MAAPAVRRDFPVVTAALPIAGSAFDQNQSAKRGMTPDAWLSSGESGTVFVPGGTTTLDLGLTGVVDVGAVAGVEVDE